MKCKLYICLFSDDCLNTATQFNFIIVSIFQNYIHYNSYSYSMAAGRSVKKKFLARKKLFQFYSLLTHCNDLTLGCIGGSSTLLDYDLRVQELVLLFCSLLKNLERSNGADLLEFKHFCGRLAELFITN